LSGPRDSFRVLSGYVLVLLWRRHPSRC